MIKRFLWLLALCGLVLSCSRSPQPGSNLKDFAGMVTVQPEPLTTETFWTYFVGTWQDPSYHGYIKFSIALDAQGKFSSLIWHPAEYKYHAEHLTTLPAFKGLTPAQLDSVSLYEKGRRVLLGTLLVPRSVEDYSQPTLADIQLMAKDPLEPELVLSVFSLLKSHMPVAPDTLFYLPVAEQINFVSQAADRFQALGIKLASRTSSQERTCYSAGWGVGRVRVVKEGELEGLLAEGAIGSDDILVMDEVPRELPVVAGIVVSQTSSPSSHPALLAGMLGIPFVYEKNATARESWQSLAQSGDQVFFQASGDAVGTCQFLLRSGASLSAAEAARLKALKKPLPLPLKDYDRLATMPILLEKLGHGDANKVGAKAANVAELRRIIPEHTVKDGLALPVGLFAEAMSVAQTADGQSLRTYLDTELARLAQVDVSAQDTVQGLARMRAAIEGAKLPADLQRRILDAIAGVFPEGTRIKLRSSSNIEDHPEFNGAGLYESKGACVGDDDRKEKTGLCQDKKDPVLKSALKVWASLYNLKAWVARRYYGVNEDFSGMGILVQKSYKGELANGVALSSYPAYNNNGEGPATIEVQSTAFPGEDLEVANPPAGKIPETVRITAQELELQIPSTEVPRGRMLMADALYRELYKHMSTVHEHYVKIMKPLDAAQLQLDMEWKLIEEKGQQKIIIKQVRPVPARVNSTQGLDRGLFMIGERQAKLCPSPSEHRAALTRLQLSRSIAISMGLHEIPADDSSRMPNPIESLRIDGENKVLDSEASLEFTPWEELWGTRNEFRSYTVSVPVTIGNQRAQLQWKGRQERIIAQKRLLVNSVQNFWTSNVRLSLDAENFEAMQVVLGDHQCESDAYQGFQPGSFQASSPYAQERKAPVAYSESFASADYAVTIQGRTSFQGFDKTRFVHSDSTVIHGILPRDLTITMPFRSVYAPGHHNFTFEYAFDVLAADQLTSAEKVELTNKGIFLLILRSVSPFADVWNDPLLETGSEEAAEPGFQLIAVDANGTEKILGVLQQTSKTDISDIGPGFGIGPFP